MTTITERVQAIQRNIAEAASRAGRSPDAVELLAVSKSHGPDSVREAYAAGQRSFGESYLQEALAKMTVLADLPIEWHYIGPIQSNKTRPIAEHFAWVHGVDRLKIAERLNEARPPQLAPLNVCIQVNVSGEASKSGCAPNEVAGLALTIAGLPRLKLHGLMTIPEPTDDVALQHRRFKILGQLCADLVQQGLKLDTLSMGMSDDYPVAIEEGATIVRIGSAIFGARQIRGIS